MADIGAWVRARPWAGDAALAVLIAVPVGASSLSLLHQAHLSSAHSGWLIAVLAALHLTVALRRVATVPAFTVAAALEAVLLAMAPLELTSAGSLVAYPAVLMPSSAVFALQLYAMAAYAERPSRLGALALGLAGAAVTVGRLARAGSDHARPVLDGTWQIAAAAVGLVVAVVAAWSLGWFRRLHAGYADALRRQEALAAVRDERARVARELHDVIAHSLAVIVRQADAGRYVARTDPERGQQILTIVAETGRAALGDMRSLLGVLRTDGTDTTAPAPTAADIAELVERTDSGGQTTRLRVTGDPVPLGSAGELAAYRVAQEGLTNVVKHAGDGATATVALDWDARGLCVSVTDDGGRTPRRAVAESGHGHRGLRERLDLLGGELDAAPTNHGYRLTAHIPATTRAAP